MAEQRDHRKRLAPDPGEPGELTSKSKTPDKVNIPAAEAQGHAVRPEVSDELVDQILSETAQLRASMAKEVFGDDPMGIADRPSSASKWQTRVPQTRTPQTRVPETRVPETSSSQTPSQSSDSDADSRRHTRKEYNEKKGEHKQKRSMKLPLILLLVFLIAGAGVFALVHFVITPNLGKDTAEPTAAQSVTEAPAAVATKDEPAPTEAPSESAYAMMANSAMQEMSKEDMICQLFMVTPEALTDGDTVTEAGDAVKDALEEYPVGGVIFSSQNFSGDEQAKSLVSGTQGYAKTPLFIAVDDDGMVSPQSAGTPQGGPSGGPQGGPEGGPQGGPDGGPGAGAPAGPGSQGADMKESSPEEAHDNALSISEQKQAVGFNVDFSLSAELDGSSDEDAGLSVDDVSQLIGSAVEGYTEGGLIASVKYFPGKHSDSDGAEGFPRLTDTAETIIDSLAPIRSGVEAGAGMIIIDHVIVDDVDSDKPATLSSKVVPQLLRDKLGYSGVTVCANVSEDVITDKYSRGEIVRGVFAADVDLILNPDDLGKYVTAVEDALDNGDITEEQLRAKVKRILTLKYERGICTDNS